MYKVDKEYQDYLFNCLETNTNPLSFQEWLEIYIEEKECS